MDSFKILILIYYKRHRNCHPKMFVQFTAHCKRQHKYATSPSKYMLKIKSFPFALHALIIHDIMRMSPHFHRICVCVRVCVVSNTQ